MTKHTTTNNYRIPADQLQNLEIDRNGRGCTAVARS
jgi:hypothetical protein